MYECKICQYHSKSLIKIKVHIAKSHNHDKNRYFKYFELKETAFNGKIMVYTSKIKYKGLDCSTFLHIMHDKILNLLKKVLKKMPFRFQLILYITFEKPKIKFVKKKPKVVYESIKTFFCGQMSLIMNKKEIKSKLLINYNKVLKSFDQFISHGSGWTIKRIKGIDIKISKYKALSGGCEEVKLPKIITIKKAIWSIKKNDKNAFYGVF